MTAKTAKTDATDATAPVDETDGTGGTDEAVVSLGKGPAADAPADEPEDQATNDEADEDEADEDEFEGAEGFLDTPPATSGVASAAAAVVSAALGLAALTGTWTGKLVAERETLIGQIKTSQGGTTAQQISEIYGDAWHGTALVNGVFSFLALVTAVLVLVLTRPERPVWVRAVAVAGAVLGVIGILLSAGMYFDLFLTLPTAAPQGPA